MKIRSGFVSNSSSSSFILDKSKLSEKNIADIKNVCELATKFEMSYPEDVGGWDLYENDSEIHGCTIIDNFNFLEFLDKIKIPEEAFKDRLAENGIHYYDEGEVNKSHLKPFVIKPKE